MSARLDLELILIGPLPVGRSAEAGAVLSCGPDGRVSHVSAAALQGLLDSSRAHLPVEVTVPRRRRRHIEGVRIHRARNLLPDEVTTIDGIPVTTPARTLLDIAGVLTSREVEQALAKALRMGLVTVEEVRRMVERHPWISFGGAHGWWRRSMATHSTLRRDRSRRTVSAMPS